MSAVAASAPCIAPPANGPPPPGANRAALGSPEPQLFSAIHDQGYTDLVSVIPPDAELVPGSGINPAKLGKIPGRREANGLWHGYAFNCAPTPDRATVKQWEREGANLGMLGKYFPAIDIDCDDPGVARRVESVAVHLFGPMPARYGRKPRLLLVGRTERPFNKRSLTFSYRGATQKVEVLADGQQYLVAGRHPTGVLYSWKGRGLDRTPPHELPVLTVKRVEELFDAILAEFGEEGVSLERNRSRTRADVPLQESLRGDLEEVRAAIASIPNDFPDRDTYRNMAYAIKAALWEQPDDAFDLFSEWASRWSLGDNDPETDEQLWKSLRPPFRIGARWLISLARRYDPSIAASKFETELPNTASVANGSAFRELVARSGLAALETGATMREAESSLRTVADGLTGATNFDRELVRNEAIRELERVGIKAPARIVDAALPPATSAVADADSQGTAVAFSEVVPWPESVDGADLLADMTAILKRYVVMGDGADTATVLWIMLAHAHDAFTVSPILAVTSPEKRCGKTTLLELLGACVPKKLFASNITAASLFRAVEAFRPTLILDEADTFLGDNDELRGVLNSGHRRDSAYVVRLVGDNHEPRQFGTWAPKAIGAIGRLPDTLEDRSIMVRMRRRRKDEALEAMRLDRLGELEHYRRKAARWAVDYLDKLRTADPSMPEGLHDRAADNWRPLLAIADAVGGEWPARARHATALLAGAVQEDQAPAEQLLSDIRALFAERHEERLPSDEIVCHLLTLDERQWGDWRQGRPLTVVQLAGLLARFDIRPKKFRFGDSTRRGYEPSQFADAFARYLPTDQPLDPERPEQSGCNADSRPRKGRNTIDDVPDAVAQPKQPQRRDVPGVPGSGGDSQGEAIAEAQREADALEAILYGTGRDRW